MARALTACSLRWPRSARQTHWRSCAARPPWCGPPRTSCPRRARRPRACALRPRASSPARSSPARRPARSLVTRQRASKDSSRLILESCRHVKDAMSRTAWSREEPLPRPPGRCSPSRPHRRAHRPAPPHTTHWLHTPLAARQAVCQCCISKIHLAGPPRTRGMPEYGKRAARAPGATCGWRRRAARSRAASCRSSRCCTPPRRRRPRAPSTRRSSPPWSAAGSTRLPAAPCSPARAPGHSRLRPFDWAIQRHLARPLTPQRTPRSRCPRLSRV
jgi:hypothetical protein